MLKETSLGNILRRYVMVALILTVLHSALAAPPVIEAQADDGVGRARALWEKVIAAKGGRERMLQIESILIVQGAQDTGYHRVTLYVWPGKTWLWSDQRPGKLGLSIIMSNSDTEASWWAIDASPQSPVRLDLQFGNEPSRSVNHLSQVVETRWDAPEPYRAGREAVDAETVDVLYARIGTHYAKYYLDPETYLPFRIDFYVDSEREPTPTESWTLYDYVDVDGLMVPSAMRINNSRKLRVTYQFDVDYDPNIFLQPPSIEAGPDAWKPKAQPQN